LCMGDRVTTLDNQRLWHPLIGPSVWRWRFRLTPPPMLTRHRQRIRGQTPRSLSVGPVDTPRGILAVMSSFTIHDESDVLVVKFETAAGLNDFRNNALRESLYELVQTRSDPLFAVDLQKVDYLS